MEVIGWGTTESGTRYWKVYNSWLNWGDQGYGKIAVGELSIGESIEAVRMSTTSGAAATTSKTRSS
jgi:cathepsin B